MTKIEDILRYILEKIIGGITLIIFYIPIIIGILAPMFFLMGFYLYFSWYLIGSNLNDWTWYYYLIPPHFIPLIIILEIAIFCVGLCVFLTGLITMIHKKFQGVKLIESGIYNYVRHPQNIGIILMVFPFCLYVPGFDDIGIRMGEIASWMFFTFFIWIYSYYEEWRLLKKFKNFFIEYYDKTGFIIPRIRRKRQKNLTVEKLLDNIGITFIVFLVTIIIFYSLVIFFADKLVMYK
jgi:protein-S-isoprenylcysteine O-methyltransferase Ste14